MPNQGWTEGKFKVETWHTGTRANEVMYFVSADPTNPTAEAVAIRFTHDSTKFGYYPNGVADMTVLATNQTLPVLTSGGYHTVRLLHSGSDWTVVVDNTSNTQTIQNVLSANRLYQIWQFDRGDGAANQIYYLDDIANPAHSATAPGLVATDSAPAHRSGMNRAPAVRR
jgi:hypothetical protein